MQRAGTPIVILKQTFALRKVPSGGKCMIKFESLDLSLIHTVKTKGALLWKMYEKN